jgi:hypothetical protein
LEDASSTSYVYLNEAHGVGAVLIQDNSKYRIRFLDYVKALSAEVLLWSPRI